jgi:hypothetical protein
LDPAAGRAFVDYLVDRQAEGVPLRFVQPKLQLSCRLVVLQLCLPVAPGVVSLEAIDMNNLAGLVREKNVRDSERYL